MDFSEKQRTFRAERGNLDNYQEHLKHNRHAVGLILDRIQDPQNIGAFFRLADAAKLKEILAYQMPGPFVNKKIKRISRSTTEAVPYRQLDQIEELRRLAQDFQVIALEWTNKSKPYQEFKPKKSCYLIIGNERSGIQNDLLNLAAESIHIPMHGLNTSMNAAMAAAIAVYHLISKLGT